MSIEQPAKITKKSLFHNIKQNLKKGDDFLSPVFAVVFVLFIFFILICLECILRERVSYIIANLNEDEEVIESRIRETIFKNPKSEIIILCTPKNPDTITILTKLEEEFPQLHILK